MKMQEAMNIINNNLKGFMVRFEWYGDGFLRTDYFPDKHAEEPLIQTEHEAWELARAFAKATKNKTCNLYVVDEKFRPVLGYMNRQIANR